MDSCEIDELMIQIAEHLEGFSPLIRTGHPAYLIGPSGARIVAHTLWKQVGRLRLVAIYPDGSRTVLPDLPRHEITVTVTRGPEHIARKITRRLLPNYRRDLANCLERLATRAAEDGTRSEFVETLLTMLPEAATTKGPRDTVIRWRLGQASGTFTMHGDMTGTTIHIQQADRELTERVADAIQQRSM